MPLFEYEITQYQLLKSYTKTAVTIITRTYYTNCLHKLNLRNDLLNDNNWSW